MSSTYASYNSYQPPEETQQTSIDSRNGSGGQAGGVTSVSVSDGHMTVKQSGVTSVNANDLTPYASEDWRSTAVKSSGSRATKIEADSRVTINGMEAHVRDFVTAGILQENQDGSFSMIGEATGGANQGQAQDAPQNNSQDSYNPDTATMPGELAAAVDAALEPFSNEALSATLPLAIAAYTGEVDMESVIRTAAQRTGLEPKDASQRVQFTMDTYQAQAVNYLTKLGLGPEDMESFHSHAVAQRGAFRNAVDRQIVSANFYPPSPTGS
jgi:hypothetical protein